MTPETKAATERMRAAGYLIVDDAERVDLQAPYLVCGNCLFMHEHMVPPRTLPPIAPGAEPRQLPAQHMVECRQAPPTTLPQLAIPSPALLAVLMPQPAQRGPAILGVGANQGQQRVSIPSAIPVSVAGLVAAYPPVAYDFPACGQFQLAAESQNGTPGDEKVEGTDENSAQPA